MKLRLKELGSISLRNCAVVSCTEMGVGITSWVFVYDIHIDYDRIPCAINIRIVS